MATYAIIGAFFIACAVLLAWFSKVKNKRAIAITFLAIAILTLHFEPIMIGLGLYQHDSTKLLGLEIRTIPIEDFLYVAFASLVVPSLWDRFGRKK